MPRSLIRLRRSDLVELSAGKSRIVSDVDDDEILFEGKVTWVQLRGGLTVHCCDCLELQRVMMECEMEPRLVFLLVEGDHKVCYGDDTVNIRVPKTDRQGMQGLALASNEPIRFKGQSQPGRRARRLVINVGAEWLESSAIDPHSLGDALSFVESDMASQIWYPSDRIRATAAQMLSPPDYIPLVQRLYLESRALDVVSEAFSNIAGRKSEAGIRLRPQDLRRIQQVMALLNSGEADDWSLDRIAKSSGINVTSLQKSFRQMTNMTVFEYQRGRKLEDARRALERNSVTVGQAASLAGYNSAANFATAFKRKFGMTPKQSRSRV